MKWNWHCFFCFWSLKQRIENIYSAFGVNFQISMFLNRILQHSWFLRNVYYMIATLTRIGKLLVSPRHEVE